MSTVSPRQSGSGLNTIDVVCDRFEEELLAGREPKIEDFLALVDTAGVDHSTLLSELLAVELEYRRKRGETPSVEEYVARFPNDREALIGAGLIPAEEAVVSSDAQETVSFDVDREVQFGQFRLLGRVGAGHFGVVWRARDTRLHRDVAIKVPRKGELDWEETQRFLREGRAAAQLSHRHIVAVHEVGDPSNPYIVSDYIDGVTLKDVVKQREFTAREAAELCVPLAEALEHAHQHGLVHRDMKPGNIILDPQGEPHIVDFGLARRISGDSTLTADDEVVGTPAYMSPEQASGGRCAVDARTDVYSLGMVLYRLLTGELPFEGEVLAVLNQVLNVEPKAPRTVKKDVPRDLETICLKAIAKDRSRRYASAAEFAADLRRFLEGETVLARRAGLLERSWRWCRRNVTVAISAVVVLAAGGALTAVAVIPDQSDELRTVTLMTEPPGANVAFMPLHELTGEPQPEEIIHAQSTSPVQLDLLPGDYLVVAYLDEQRFHEVFRHVPDKNEGLPGWRNHLRWKKKDRLILELPAIKIPDPSITDGMAYIEGRSDFEMGPGDPTSTATTWCSIPSFYMDCHEFTLRQYKERSGGHPPGDRRWVPVSDDCAVAMQWNDAAGLAESLGKRLPSEAEYEFAATARGTHKYPWGDTMPDEALQVTEIGPVGSPEFDRLETNPPVIGLCSNVAEWTTTWDVSNRQKWPNYTLIPVKTLWSRRIVRGGDWCVIDGNGVVSATTRNPRTRVVSRQHKVIRGLGFRCVRSARPRLRPEDFVTVLSDPPPEHRQQIARTE